MLDTNDNNTETVSKIVKKVRVAMLVTPKDAECEGRPQQAFPEPEAGRILFMTESQHVLDENDRAKIKELWTPWVQAFWDSPEDPSIRIIDVTPHRARYWDAPNRVATMIAVLGGRCHG